MNDQLIIPVLDDAREAPRADRAQIFLDALAATGLSVRDQRVIDLGAGFGSLSIASARAGAADVWAVDANEARVDEIVTRASAAGVNVNGIAANLLAVDLQLPPCDIAFMIGVVEYAGLWDASKSVEGLQVTVLRTALSSLAPGGTLILGSKNRLWPRFAWKDVHTGQPLVNSVPRPLARRLTRQTPGGEYRHYIHSPRGWTRLLHEAGFTGVKVNYPFLSYQFPLIVSAKPRWSDVRRLRDLRRPQAPREVSVGPRELAKAALMAAAASVGIPLSQSVFILAKRPATDV